MGNLLKHPTFLNYEYTTSFIDTTADLFKFSKRRDRATKILTYIADITVNGHPETQDRASPAGDIKPHKAPVALGDRAEGTNDILTALGPKGLADWMKAQDRLLLTDTTMRDGHK